MKFNINPSVIMQKIILACFFLFLLACKKTEKVETLTLEELYPLQIGKYITYRLDSTVFVNAGKLEEIHRYRVRHIVEQKVKDNLNRDGWRVNVYINDSLGRGPWVVSSSYIVIPAGKQLEVLENNLRVVKIHLPAKEGFTWKGNSYLPDRPYNPEFPLTIDGKMASWDFTYESINQTEKIGSLTINDVTTITHINDTTNFPVWKDTSFASREYSLDKFAKNTGLVYREYILREFQPRPRSTGTPPVTTYDQVWIGFGIKMWMIDKN
jgi:hypothetical protein